MNYIGQTVGQVGDTLSTLGNASLSGIYDKALTAMGGYSEIEGKVREATNQDPWGPSGTQMAEIAKFTRSRSDCEEVMKTISARLQDRHWRHVYKALVLLDYLLKNGSSRVLDTTQANIYELRALEGFQYKDSEGVDRGINVRVKAKDIKDLVRNPDRLADEREKAQRMKGKYTGTSASETTSGGGDSSRYGGFDRFGRTNGGDDSGSKYSSRYDDNDYGGSSRSSRYDSSKSDRYSSRGDDGYGGSRKGPNDMDKWAARPAQGGSLFSDEEEEEKPRRRSPSPGSRRKSESTSKSRRDDDDSPPSRRKDTTAGSPPRSRSNKTTQSKKKTPSAKMVSLGAAAEFADTQVDSEEEGRDRRGGRDRDTDRDRKGRRDDRGRDGRGGSNERESERGERRSSQGARRVSGDQGLEDVFGEMSLGGRPRAPSGGADDFGESSDFVDAPAPQPAAATDPFGDFATVQPTQPASAFDVFGAMPSQPAAMPAASPAFYGAPMAQVAPMGMAGGMAGAGAGVDLFAMAPPTAFAQPQTMRQKAPAVAPAGGFQNTAGLGGLVSLDPAALSRPVPKAPYTQQTTMGMGGVGSMSGGFGGVGGMAGARPMGGMVGAMPMGSMGKAPQTGGFQQPGVNKQNTQQGGFSLL